MVRKQISKDCSKSMSPEIQSHGIFHVGYSEALKMINHDLTMSCSIIRGEGIDKLYEMIHTIYVYDVYISIYI